MNKEKFHAKTVTFEDEKKEEADEESAFEKPKKPTEEVKVKELSSDDDKQEDEYKDFVEKTGRIVTKRKLTDGNHFLSARELGLSGLISVGQTLPTLKNLTNFFETKRNKNEMESDLTNFK
jgi:hypothetical protein